MKKAIAILVVLQLALAAVAQSTPNSSQGQDFWLMFLYNNGDQNPNTTSLIATGENNAIITVTNPYTNWSTTANLSAGSPVIVTIPIPSSTVAGSGTTATRHLGLHVTSTADISLFADNYRYRCYDATMVLPTSCLSDSYILQDYPENAEAGFVATEDNTILTMILPCPLINGSYQAGDTLTVNLSQGESYQIMAASAHSFSGMRVTSNGHPFAAFQGCYFVHVPVGSSGADLLYEQAIPLSRWGKNHVVVSTANRSGGDQVRITSSENNCVVNISGTVACTLQAHQTYEFQLPAYNAKRITTTKPVAVCTYLRSTGSGGSPGDPASVVNTPMEQGIDHISFYVVDHDGLVSHYINIVALTSELNGITLDGTNIASQFSVLDSLYSYTRKQVSTGVHTLSSTSGNFVAYYYGLGSYSSYAYSAGMRLDSINDPQPPIQVHDTITYLDTTCQNSWYTNHGFNLNPMQTAATGNIELWRTEYNGDTTLHIHLTLTVLPISYGDTTAHIYEGDTLFYADTAFTTAGTYTFYLTAANGCDSILRLHIECTPRPITTDTTAYFDSVCQGLPYENYGFSVDAATTANAGTLELWRNELVGDTLHYYHLLLTILPHTAIDTEAVIIQGDTLFFADTTLMEAGDYTFTFTAANGCDSTVTLHLTYAVAGISASADGICPGDTLTLTATGTYYFLWAADPPDPDLEAQQGQASVNVSPQQTTTYYLLDAEGHTVAELMVGIDNPPVLCFEVERPFVDFDHPVVYFTDCSEGHATSIWTFSDGITLTGDKLRRQFHYPLPDSVVVTLTSCNRYLCCVDTTFTVPVCIRSVWFPNIFTPGLETNNRFGCTASFEIVEFELYIYNRQGLLVYHTDDPTALWDGTRNGAPMPQGAYVYYWFAKDAYDFRRNGAGTVTLLR